MKYAIITDHDFVIREFILGAPNISFDVYNPKNIPEKFSIPVIRERLELCYKGKEVSEYNKELFQDPKVSEEEKLDYIIRLSNNSGDRLCCYKSTITVEYKLSFYNYIGSFYGYLSNAIRGKGLDRYDSIVYIPTFGLTLAEIADKYADDVRHPERNLIRLHQKEAIRKCLKDME